MNEAGNITDRTRKHPLTKQQVEVLRLLDEKPRASSTSSVSGYVQGTVVAALVRRGLALCRAPMLGDPISAIGQIYEITPAGRRALAMASDPETCAHCSCPRERHEPGKAHTAHRGMGPCSCGGCSRFRVRR